jgi:Fe(3+) dicitrate transport protein
MKIIHLSVSLLVLFLSQPNSHRAFGQSGNIAGKIALEAENTPATSIYVFLDATGYGTITSGKGTFNLENIPAGQYHLVAAGVGFTTLQQEVSVKANETLHLQLEMAENVLGLPAVVVQSVSLTGGLRGLRNIPGSAHYISAQEIQKFSYTDINRTLRAVPGINLQEEDGFGLRPNIGLRGTGSERSSKITLMEDGVLAAPAPYAAPAAYYFPTIGRMQAVEILKGSSQIRFGPFTTGGAINLISTPVPSAFSGRIHLLGGSFASRNLHAFAGNSHRNFGYLVETFQYQSDGFKKLDGGGSTGFDKKDFLAKFRVNTNPGAKIYQSLTFKIGQAREDADETYLGLTQADFDKTPYRRYAASQMDKMDTKHQQLSATHVAQFSPSIDLTTTAYNNKFSRNWYKLDKVKESTGQTPGIASLLDDPTSFSEAYGILTGETSLLNNALSVKANNRSYRSKGIQTVLALRFPRGQVRHNFDIGFRYHFDEMDRFQWTDEYKMEKGAMKLTQAGTPGTESNRLESAKAFAAYTQYKMQWGKWTVIPGMRYENIRLKKQDFGKNDPERTGENQDVSSNNADVFIPGIGITYKMDAQLDIFAGVHRGFSPPGTQQESKPEYSINYELGTRYRKEVLSGQVVLFFNDYDNLLGADLAAAGGTGSTDLFNGGEVLSKGLEFQLTYDLLAAKEKGWNMPLSAVYTYTDATFRRNFNSEFEGWGKVEAGDELPYLARHQVALVLSLNDKKFGFNLSGRYQSAMRTEAGQGSIPYDQKTDAFFVLDANASYAVHPKIAVFGSVSNLTDKTYVVARRPAGLRPGLPRTLHAGLKVDF